MKQNPKLAFGAILMMLCLLFLALTPAASAARMHDGHKRTSRMRWMPRMENGIVTDDDGIIGNSATGADHARYGRRPHPAHLMTGSDIPSDPLDVVPDLPQNGTNGDMNEIPNDNNGIGNDDVADGVPNSGTDMLPDPAAGDTADDTDGNIANDNGNEVNDGMADGAARASGVLPWIIAIIVLLAVVLIVLSLMPKKKRNT